jgi:hypothetical protein
VRRVQNAGSRARLGAGRLKLESEHRFIVGGRLYRRCACYAEGEWPAKGALRFAGRYLEVGG